MLDKEEIIVLLLFLAGALMGTLVAVVLFLFRSWL